MRRAPKTPLVSGSLYRNVAMLAVGLAVLFVLFGGDGASAPDPVPAPVSKPASIAAPAPTANIAAAQFDETADVAEPAEPAAPAAAGGEAPPLPDGTTLPGTRGAQAAPARPTPAQLRHLVEQSRIRSGANPGGD